LKDDHKVIVYDSLYKGHREAVVKGADFVHADLADAQRLKSIPARVGPRRAGDPAVLIASSEKIKRELDWNAEFRDLRVIIESAWRWMRKHRMVTRNAKLLV
jgi:UDP-glucose 4-epimerase